MTENLTFSEADGVLTAHLSGEIDHHTAKPIRERIDREIAAGRPDVLELDFSGVPFTDSSGIGLILGRTEAARSVGATVRITGMRPEIARIVRLAGLEKIKGLVIGASYEVAK